MALPIGIAAGMIKSDGDFRDKTGLLGMVEHITFGSFTNGVKVGNVEPVFWYDDEEEMSLNAVGLSNYGLHDFISMTLPEVVPLFRGTGCRLRASLAPLRTGDLAAMSDMLSGISGIDEVEINAACPNHRGEHGLHPVLAHDPHAVEQLLRETGTLRLPKALKIAPDMKPETLATIVRLCATYGIRTIVSSNTRPSSSIIGGVQRLSVDRGGIGGTPLLTAGVRQVEELKRIMQLEGMTDMKVIACGGIMDGHAARLYEAAGADEGEVATLFYQFGVRGVQDLLLSMQ